MSITTSSWTTNRGAAAEAVRTIRTRALNRITAYTAKAQQAAANPEAATEDAHRERAAYWACTAREAGATEAQIDAAEAAGTAEGTA